MLDQGLEEARFDVVLLDLGELAEDADAERASGEGLGLVWREEFEFFFSFQD